MNDTTEHVTHIERSGDNATFYFWCEADDCYARRRRYLTEMEALDAAAEHEARPG